MNNRVHCALAPREVAKAKEFTDTLQNIYSSGAYTHHQKTVICDAADPHSTDGRRRLVAFVGGLDLTGGRYDTPEHELFSTLRTDHSGDFRNSNAKGIVTGDTGPREPWHDIHSKVEGPVAKDVLENFIERWKQQGTKECPAPVIDDYFCSQINPEAVAVQQIPHKNGMFKCSDLSLLILQSLIKTRSEKIHLFSQERKERKLNLLLPKPIFNQSEMPKTSFTSKISTSWVLLMSGVKTPLFCVITQFQLKFLPNLETKCLLVKDSPPTLSYQCGLKVTHVLLLCKPSFTGKPGLLR